MSQSFTFIDVTGDQSQYTVSDKDYQGNFHWSTDHGMQGSEPSLELAQYRARIVSRDSMAANRRSEETSRLVRRSVPWRSR